MLTRIVSSVEGTPTLRKAQKESGHLYFAIWTTCRGSITATTANPSRARGHDTAASGANCPVYSEDYSEASPACEAMTALGQIVYGKEYAEQIQRSPQVDPMGPRTCEGVRKITRSPVRRSSMKEPAGRPPQALP